MDNNTPTSLPKGAKLLLVVNAASTAFLLWGTAFVILHPAGRWPAFGRIRAPYLAILLATILVFIVKAWRGSRRATNWVAALYAVFVAVCIWDGAMIVANGARLGIEINKLTAISWPGVAGGISPRRQSYGLSGGSNKFPRRFYSQGFVWMAIVIVLEPSRQLRQDGLSIMARPRTPTGHGEHVRNRVQFEDSSRFLY